MHNITERRSNLLMEITGNQYHSMSSLPRIPSDSEGYLPVRRLVSDSRVPLKRTVRLNCESADAQPNQTISAGSDTESDNTALDASSMSIPSTADFLANSRRAGAMMSPEDSCDCVFEHLAKASAAGKYEVDQPDTFDLRTVIKFPTPRDQGSRGTCAAMVGATIKEIQEARDCGFAGRMSPEFIYYHRDNKPSGGMYGRNVFQILQKIGSVPENLYKYRNDESAMKPSEELYEIANHFKIANFARVKSVDGLKKALLEIGPCYIQLPLYSTRPEFWRASNPADKPDGGHALTVIGYTLDGFILQNSWGAEWNGDGCIVFPYAEWDDHWECWVSVDEHTEPDDATNILEKSARLAGTPRNSASDHRAIRRRHKSRKCTIM